MRRLNGICGKFLEKEELFVGQPAAGKNANTLVATGLFKPGNHGIDRLAPACRLKASVAPDHGTRDAVF